MSQNIKAFNWRSFAGIGIGILVILFVLELLSGIGSGTGMNMYNNREMGYNGIGFSGLLASLFLIAIKFLWLVFVISLIAGLAVAFKKYIANPPKVDLNIIDRIIPQASKCENCGMVLREEFKYCPGCKTEVKLGCDCGTALQPDWKHCPGCGKATGQE